MNNTINNIIQREFRDKDTILDYDKRVISGHFKKKETKSYFDKLKSEVV